MIHAQPTAKPAPGAPGSTERAMHPWIVSELVHHHHADLDREAARVRLAAEARAWSAGRAGGIERRPVRAGHRELRAAVAELLFARHTPHLRSH
jgi:hypothetical protein